MLCTQLYNIFSIFLFYFTGMAMNKNEYASTIMTFMIKSLAGKYSDVVAMYPISGFSIQLLDQLLKEVLQGVMDAGFDCVCLISDNHPLNRAYFKSLGDGELVSRVPNPCDHEKNIFLLIDPTHNIKNLYNNFNKRKVFQIKETEHFPALYANFHHIQELYDLESCYGLRMAYKLNNRMLSPTSIQRTSVKLAVALFHETTFSALNFYASSELSKSKWASTATFIKIVHKLWSMINVKTSTIGRRLADDTRSPISSSTDERLHHLEQYEEFFRAWNSSPGKNKPSNETLRALVLMCSTLRLIVIDLLDKGFQFVLLGHLQSDPLEHRFGEYRQRSGSNYFLAVKQVMETERKMKVSRSVQLKR